MSANLDLNTIETKASSFLHTLYKYRLLLFVVFIAALYGFLVWRISAFATVEPDSTAVANKVQSSHTPHIDTNVVKKIQELQDNSVSVKALFNDARSSPFQE
jgi:hypothetical protein